MKKLIYSLILLLLISGCSTVANDDVLERVHETKTIVWGVKIDTNLFGLLNIETQEIEGFDIDMAKEITAIVSNGEAEAEFVEVTSKTRIPLLKNGNVDAVIATMTITEARREVVDFSDVYFEEGQSLLVPESSDIQSIEDLDATKTVLAVKGSTSASNIREIAPDVNVLELENYSECFTALQSGQGDAMTTDNSILLGITLVNEGYRIAGDKFTDEPYGIAINKNQDAFLDAVNDALVQLKESGKYQEIYERWFPNVD